MKSKPQVQAEFERLKNRFHATRASAAGNSFSIS
jgi:DNA-binding GntR family transcriptional regulator